MYSITYYELIFLCVEMMRIAEERKDLYSMLILDAQFNKYIEYLK